MIALGEKPFKFVKFDSVRFTAFDDRRHNPGFFVAVAEKTNDLPVLSAEPSRNSHVICPIDGKSLVPLGKINEKSKYVHPVDFFFRRLCFLALNKAWFAVIIYVAVLVGNACKETRAPEVACWEELVKVSIRQFVGTAGLKNQGALSRKPEQVSYMPDDVPVSLGQPPTMLT